MIAQAMVFATSRVGVCQWNTYGNRIMRVELSRDVGYNVM